MPSPLSGKTAPPANPHIRTAIVVGGGVVGQTIALRLQQGGIATTLIDPEAAPRGASWGNAGHIAVEQVAPLASRRTIRSIPGRLFSRGGAVALPWREAPTWLPFAASLIRASGADRLGAGTQALGAMLAEAMPAWSRLLHDTGAPRLLRNDGHFILWESAATAAAGRAAWTAAETGTASFRDTTPDERAQLGALIRRPIAGAIRFSGSGRITDLGELAGNLDESFAAIGGTRLRTRATRIANRGGKPVALLEDGRSIEADALVVAAGIRSGGLLRPLGHKVPMIAERGYHLQSPALDWPVDLPPLVFEDRSMIATRFRSGLRAASFVEFARADSPADPRKWERLRHHAAALGLPIAADAQRWMGCRPTLPDYLPAIGASTRFPGLYYAFGHQHLGLTLAATTAEALGSLILGRPAPWSLEPFALERFTR